MPIQVTHLLGRFPVLYERPILDEIAALEKEGVHAHIAAFYGAPWPLTQELWPLEKWVDYLDMDWESGRLLSGMETLACSVVAALAYPRMLMAGVAACTGMRQPAVFWRRVQLGWRVRERKSNLIHAQFGNLGLLAYPVAQWMPKPLLVSFRGQDVMLARRASEAERQALWRTAERIFARSADMARDIGVLGCPPEKIIVHPTGINTPAIRFLERKHPGKERKINVLMAGRLVRKKGMDDGLRALAQCRLGATGPTIWIAGEGPERGPLERLAEDLHIRQRVEFLGELSREELLDQVMPAAHIFLAPCRTTSTGEKEGVPNALKEAMATGLPVVATRHAGIPECVAHGESGLLAPEGDINALAASLDTMLSQPETWPAMGRKGRAVIEKNYDIARLAPKMAAYYYDVMSSLRK